jgi:hypothetical protein
MATLLLPYDKIVINTMLTKRIKNNTCLINPKIHKHQQFNVATNRIRFTYKHIFIMPRGQFTKIPSNKTIH